MKPKVNPVGAGFAFFVPQLKKQKKIALNVKIRCLA